MASDWIGGLLKNWRYIMAYQYAFYFEDFYSIRSLLVFIFSSSAGIQLVLGRMQRLGQTKVGSAGENLKQAILCRAD